MDWLGIGSAVLGAFGDVWSTNQANSFNSAMLEKQMEYNREVMQHRHQWEVEDLRAAGLNPLMSTTSPTGTLNAPTGQGALKADVSSNARSLMEFNIANKQATAQLNSAKADMYNAETNKINAETNKLNANTAIGSLENEQIRTQNDFRIASEQINLAVKELNLKELLTKADVSLKDQQRIYQEIQNHYAPDIAQAELDYKVQEIVLAAETAAASIELMRKQGNAADAAALESSTKAYLNERMADLTDTEREQLSFKLETDRERWKGEKPKRQREAFEEEQKEKWRRSYPGQITFGAGVILDDVFHSFGAGARVGKTTLHTR